MAGEEQSAALSDTVSVSLLNPEPCCCSGVARASPAASHVELLPLGICTRLNSDDALSTPSAPIDRLTAVNHELLDGAGHKAGIKTVRPMRASRKRAHYRAGRARRAAELVSDTRGGVALDTVWSGELCGDSQRFAP